jgi:hypothetical protein
MPPAVAGAAASEEGAEAELPTTLLAMSSRSPMTGTMMRGLFAHTPSRRCSSRFRKSSSSRYASILSPPVIQAAPKLRRSKTPKPGFTPRRSVHLAAKPRAANATIQVQNILLQKLGIAVNTDAVDAEVVQKFRTAFAAPMSAYKQNALQVLFSGDFDLVAMNLDLAGFDAEGI